MELEWTRHDKYPEQAELLPSVSCSSWHTTMSSYNDIAKNSPIIKFGLDLRKTNDGQRYYVLISDDPKVNGLKWYTDGPYCAPKIHELRRLGSSPKSIYHLLRLTDNYDGTDVQYYICTIRNGKVTDTYAKCAFLDHMKGKERIALYKESDLKIHYMDPGNGKTWLSIYWPDSEYSGISSSLTMAMLFEGRYYFTCTDYSGTSRLISCKRPFN